MARTNFSDLHKEVTDHPGAKERLAAKRAETLEEIRLYQLRHSETVSQAELAGRLDVTRPRLHFRRWRVSDAAPISSGDRRR